MAGFIEPVTVSACCVASQIGCITDMWHFMGVMLLATLVLCKHTDYIHDKDTGVWYKLMYHAETWQDAKEACAGAGGKLAVPKSQHEFSVIQTLVRRMHYPSVVNYTGSVLLAWVGISDDGTAWRNVDGEDIKQTGFSTWAKGNGDRSSDPKEPHCVAIDAINPGLRSYWCHYKQPYVCESEDSRLT